MNKKLKTAKGTLCSLASVLSSGVLMVSNVSAANVNYYSGTTANDGIGTKALQKTIGSSENKYRGLYTEGITTNGALDSKDAIKDGVTATENIIRQGFEFKNWKAGYSTSNWSNIGERAVNAQFGQDECSDWHSRSGYCSEYRDLTVVAQWTDLKKAVFANGSTERMVVGTPFEVKNDEDVKIGEISLSYRINTTRDADGATVNTPLAVTSIDEKITFAPDEANGYELKKVEVKAGDADAEDATEHVYDDEGVLTLGVIDAKEDIEINAKMGLKEFNVTASVTDEDHASVSPIPAVEYGDAAIFEVVIADGFKVSKVVKGEEETEFILNETGELIIENITADAEYIIVVEPEVYQIIEGDGQDINVAEIDKALFRFDGPFDLFDSLTIDGEEFTNYEVSEGSTLIAIAKDDLIALGEGEHKIEALYKNGTSAEASFTVSGIPTTPETGANSKLGASTVVSILAYAVTGSALALALLAIKRKMNR